MTSVIRILMTGMHTRQSLGHDANGEPSVGEYPYNVNTKIGALNLAYPDTMYYECDLAHAHCNSCEGTVLSANVTMVIAK